MSSSWIHNNANLILLSILLQALILTMIAIFLLIFPAYGSLLPGMNLVFSTFGHSHLAAVLILLLPISYYYAVVTHRKTFLLLSLFLLLGLLSSFGRVAVMIGLFQTLTFTGWYILRFRNRPEFSKLIFLSLITFISLFGFIAATKLFISINPQSPLAEAICESSSQVRKVCKDLSREPRPYYWQQAYVAFKEYPVTGYGLGTFTLINERWRQSNGYNTSYAHSAYFEQFAETGLVGGISLLLLVMYMIGLGFKGFVKEPDPAKKLRILSLLIAVVGMSVNVVFDFDWSFRGVFLLTMLLFALLMSELYHSSSVPEKKHPRLVIIPKLLFIVATIFSLAIVVSSVALSKEIIVSPLLAFQDNPEKVIEKSSQLSSEDKAKLLSIFKYHPELYSRLLSKEDDVIQKFNYAQKLMEIAPWRGIFLSQATELLDQKFIQEAEIDLTSRIVFLQENEAQGHTVFSYYDRSKLADAAISLADELYLQGRPEKSGWLYQQAYSIDAWSLSKKPPIFSSYPNAEMTVVLLPFLYDVETKYLNENRQLYLQAFISQANYKILYQPTASFEPDLIAALSMDDSAYWLIKDQLLPTLIQQVETNVASANFVAAENLANQSLYWIEQIKADDRTELSLSYEDSLANMLVKIGNWQMMNNQASVAVTNFQSAQQLNPVVLETTNAAIKLWLEDSDWREKSASELLSYADGLSSLHLANIRAEQEHTQLLQYLATKSTHEGESETAEKILDTMQSVSPTDYWVAVQKANWYVYQRDDQQAEAALRMCLEQFADHRDCQLGLEALLAESPHRDRFFEVSQILMGEKTYHDFE